MEELREVMRKWVTGVSIVTAEYGGVKHGMTVGSLVSVSIDPPRIVITLANQTRTHSLVMKSGIFGVTILGEEQKAIAERFSGSVPDHGDRFTGLELISLGRGIPVLKDGMAQLGCEVVHRYEMPQSTLFVAEVLVAHNGNLKVPLVYGNRQYHRLELK